MKQLKIALTALAAESGISQENWKTVPLKGADLTDVSAVVMTSRDEIPAAYDTIHAFSIPLFILDTGEAASRNMSEISGTLLPIKEKSSWKKRITRAALQYEKDLLPPFFGALMKYTSRKNDEYDSPGHQGGAFFRKHPAGRIFYYYYGPNVFRGDLSSSDVDLGDFLIHEGAALSAQKHAAKVFHADKTYFVLNGTSTSNKIVMNAVLAPGDMVLYDRNNHKSIDLGLVLSGAIPVYMETARNACGSIGGIPERCFDEDYIRKLVAEKDPEKAKAAQETVANLDAGKLIDAGKVDDLKMEIKKSYDGKISDLEKALADSKKDSADRLAAKEASIRTLLVKGIFDSSAFLKDKTVLPSDVAYASFGRHFEVKEENGELRVVATMNGQPIFSRSDPGTFAAPEEALEAIIDKYPMKDRILKAPDGGSGSHPNSAYAPGAKIIPKGDMSAFGANLEAIAKGEVTVAAQ